MPQVRRARTSQGPAAVLSNTSSSHVCLCGNDEGIEGWTAWQSVGTIAELDLLKEFWRTLKPATRTTSLKIAPAAALPEITEGMGMDLEEGLEMALKYIKDQKLTEAIQTYFSDVLDEVEGTMRVSAEGFQTFCLPEPLVIAVTKDALSVELLEELVGARNRQKGGAGGGGGGGLGVDHALLASPTRFGGSVPSTHTVAPSKQGLVRFPITATQNPEGSKSIQESAGQGVCKPLHGVHFRPWAFPAELDVYRSMTLSARYLTGMLTYLQRKLQRSAMRADAVKHLMSIGAMASGGSSLSSEQVNAAAERAFQTWSWGSGPDGQLGQGAAKQCDGPGLLPMLEGTEVVQLCASSGHAFARTATGDLLSWGSGTQGITGRCDQEAARHPLPLLVRAANSPIASISSGPLHSLVLGNHGRVMAWGSAWLGQLGNTEKMMSGGCLLPYQSSCFEGVTRLTPGTPFSSEYQEFVFGVKPPPTDNGEIGGIRACLAILDSLPIVTGPFSMPGGRGLRPGAPLKDVVSIAAGGVHSAAVTKDGALLVWGSNEEEGLSIKLSEAQKAREPWVQGTGCGCCDGKDTVVLSISSPTPVEMGSLKVGKMAKVAAGIAITVALSVAGEVISFGASDRKPFRVDKSFASGEKGALVAAGGRWGMAATEPSGLVYTWARHHQMEWVSGQEQQLASRSLPFASWTAVQVPFVSKAFLIDCSDTHGIAATKDGKVYWWPHTEVHQKSQPVGAGIGNHEVTSLRGLRVLSVAVGDSFALASTAPERESLEELQSEQA